MYILQKQKCSSQNYTPIHTEKVSYMLRNEGFPKRRNILKSNIEDYIFRIMFSTLLLLPLLKTQPQ